MQDVEERGLDIDEGLEVKRENDENHLKSPQINLLIGGNQEFWDARGDFLLGAGLQVLKVSSDETKGFEVLVEVL